MTTTLPQILDFTSLRALYAAGTSPLDLVNALIERLDAATDPAVFITRATPDQLRAAAADLIARAPEPNSLPLWGIPFAIKDNIDAAGLPTTAACPTFAYSPEQDATVIARLRAAGAIVVGKTNLDQFATGLNGTRSPYGAPRSVFNADYVSGGSSSGSAVAVASGLAAFALGTDTAGSGRVPAAFNNLVGIKPSPGRVPNTGVVPACRSVDVVTVMAANVTDGIAVRAVMDGYDAADPFSRKPASMSLPPKLRVGVLMDKDKEFYGNHAFAGLYEEAIARAKKLGAEIVLIDYAPFRDAAALLYQGPWVAERLAAIEDFFAKSADEMDPTVRTIIGGATKFSAVDAFNGRYELGRLRQLTLLEWAKADVLLLPTSPDIQTVEAMRADPIALNSRFGLYTNFANLLDYSAIAVPAGFTANGLPFGVMLVAPQDCDDALAPFANAMHQAAATGSGLDRTKLIPAVTIPGTDRIEIAVVGAHLTGMPLNPELTALGGWLVEETRTAPQYRLYALKGTVPPKPGLQRVSEGEPIIIEVWSLPAAGFGTFVSKIPAPLGVGKLVLADGRHVTGFLCEATALDDAADITNFGGWRAYIASKAKTTA
ncbi:allophanate hydrolase [Devosia sp. Leaf420]|uniref:allophanate hydrolase n=1 Tax=Devosia sp. Leaf420 TaxID=1736374 RepID=UPI0007130D9C|nr:allophanate hydrolase [Devosia sp. Leaf420]KQT42833.1 allophanate hydrolase [Devosia sp. Leaf420]